MKNEIINKIFIYKKWFFVDGFKKLKNVIGKNKNCKFYIFNVYRWDRGGVSFFDRSLGSEESGDIWWIGESR